MGSEHPLPSQPDAIVAIPLVTEVALHLALLAVVVQEAIASMVLGVQAVPHLQMPSPHRQHL